MKVMIVCPRYGPPWNEGSKNLARVLKEGLTSSGIEVVILPRETQSARSSPLLWAVFKNVWFLWKAARQARAQGVHVIHMLSSASSLLGLKSFLLKNWARIPLVLHITGLGRPRLGYRLLLRADRILVGGQYLRELFPQAQVLPPLSPHFNLPSPDVVPPDVHPNSDASIRRILYLGAMEPVRGVHILVDAARQLRDRFHVKGFRVTLAWNGYGSDEYAREVRAEIARSDLQECFEWEGSVEEVGDLYRSHDLVVIPRVAQERMGFPLRLIEAMSYGKPLVVSDIGEMPKVLNGCGLVVPAGESRALARALYRLLTDRAFYQECVRNCYRNAAHYHPTRVLSDLISLYKELSHVGEGVLRQNRGEI